MFVNLTPHPMHIYPIDTPDRIEPGTVNPTHVIMPATDLEPARFGEITIGIETPHLGVPIVRIVLGHTAHGNTIPAPVDNVLYIVSRLVALAYPHRSDLLVPFGTIRDVAGRTIGSRGLARPIPAADVVT